MKEDETVGKYFLRVEELVNAMKALGEKIEEHSLVQKILRSMPDNGKYLTDIECLSLMASSISTGRMYRGLMA
jgi:hypothetical protein